MFLHRRLIWLHSCISTMTMHGTKANLWGQMWQNGRNAEPLPCRILICRSSKRLNPTICMEAFLEYHNCHAQYSGM